MAIGKLIDVFQSEEEIIIMIFCHKSCENIYNYSVLNISALKDV